MKYIFPIAIAAFPFLVSAQGTGGIDRFLRDVSNIVADLIPIVIGIAVLVFIWGILQYVVATDPEKQKEARKVILYGIIVLFVMVSVWGLVNLIGETLNLDNSLPDGPAVPRAIN